LILLSLSTVAASDDSQSIIATNENPDVQVQDTLLSSASDDISEISVNDDLISADAGDENDTGIYAASENLLDNLNSDEKENVTMDISADKDVVDVGENATITITLPGDATGLVSVGLKVVNVTDGVATYNYSSNSAGNHTVTVVYYGNAKYNFAISSFNITVLEAPPKENVTMDITAVPDEIMAGDNAVVTVTLPEDATGLVSVGLKFVNVTDGVAVANYTSKSAGNHTVTVVYYGDKKYNFAVGSVNITVLEAPPKENVTMDITAVPDEILPGENVSVTVTLPEDATGIVSIGLKFVNVTDGVAVANVSSFIRGNYTVPVIYYGDDKYNYAIGAFNITVLNTPPKENVTMDITAVPDEIIVGDNAVVTVTLPEDATGLVSVGLKFVNVTDGVALADYSPLIPGNHTVTVVYYGDDKYNYAIGKVNVTVLPLPPKENVTMDITAVPEEIYPGENATVTVTLPEDATGIVSIGLKVVNVTDGVATANFASCISGKIPVPVIYYGDKKYNYAFDIVNVTVLDPKQNVTMDIAVEPEEIYPGENATVTVTLPEDATGIVSIGLTFVNVTDGVAAAEVRGFGPGNIVVPVIYYGDKNYRYAFDTVNVTVLDPKQNVTMDIAVEPEEIYVGENATITVTLPEDATGKVSIGIKVVNVTDGVATANFASSISGKIPVPVIYYGDDNYRYAIDYVNVTFLSTKADPKMNVTADKEIIAVGENVTVVAELPENATGKVSIGLKVVNVTDGIATANITLNIPGKFPVPVIYYGDENYKYAYKIFNLTVTNDEGIVIIAPNVTKYYKGSERFVVNVTDFKGNPLADKTVEIVINDASYTRTTDENGTASMALGLNSGEYDVTTTVDNETVDSVVTILPTVFGEDVVKVFRNATQYYATFLDSEGNYLADGTEVTFNINGVMYKRYINGTEGKARLNINLEQGEYIITAMNPVTGENAANNITVLSKLVENKDVTKYYRNATPYTVKVIGDDGNPVGAGVTVRFNINGVFYERQTDENGIAKLNLNLQPGDYIITAEYEGCMVSNDISILPVLSANDLIKKYGSQDSFVANLVDGQGKPLANQKIQFNIHGVFYYRTTDSLGQAKLNINLIPGEYIITSSYNDANIANTVKVEA
jgi:hypothetical protein